MHNLHRDPFGPNEPIRRLVTKTASRRESVVSVAGPTQTVEAELCYGDLKYRVRVLPSGVLEIWAHGAGYPTMMVKQGGAGNTVELWPHEMFTGPAWKHPETLSDAPSEAEAVGDPSRQ